MLLALTAQQVCDLRTPESTKAIILEQLSLSTRSGGTDKVKKMTTASGINDSASSSVSKLLLDMGKELRRRDAGKVNLSEEEIHKILQDELAKHMSKNPINPLIGMPGQCAGKCVDVC